MRQLKSKGSKDYREYRDELFSQQNGLCAACGAIPSKTPHLDHNHSTWQVRGVLCASCNTLLGRNENCWRSGASKMSQDELAERLEGLAKYLRAGQQEVLYSPKPKKRKKTNKGKKQCTNKKK